MFNVKVVPATLASESLRRLLAAVIFEKSLGGIFFFSDSFNLIVHAGLPLNVTGNVTDSFSLSRLNCFPTRLKAMKVFI